MAYRELEVTLLSARDLKSVNLFTRMDVYAVASISGDPMTRQCTPTDTTGGRNPSWNATLRFSVPPSAASGGGWLHVLLRSQRALGDRDVGEVVIPLAELLAGADGTGPQPPKQASYQVHTVLRGEPRGVLNMSYRLGPVVAPVAEGYPAPQQPYQYHPQHNGYAPSQQAFKPQNPQQPYEYHDAYAPPFKAQNPQQPYQYYDAYAPAQQPVKAQNPQQASKPQNPAAPQQPYQYYDAYAPAQQPIKPQNPQQASKPQNPVAPQQPYQYYDAYAPAQQPIKPQNPQQASKPQNPATPQQASKPQNPATPQQASKPQTPAAPQQPYQYNPQHDDYAAPAQQPTKPQTPAPKQQPYQYPDAYARQQSWKPQPPASPPQKPSYAPPPRHEAAGGYGPTNYYMGPHTQIILGAPLPPARSNSFPAKTKDGPKPSYTPFQPSKSPSKADHSWPTSAQHQNSPTWPNASPKTPERPTPAQQHDTKTAAPTLQHVTSLGKTTEHSSWPKASPHLPQSTPPAWPKSSSPNKNPDSSATARSQQHDTKVVEHNVQKPLTKVSSGKPDHSARPQQALEEQKSTQVSVTKTNGTLVGGDYARSQSSNFQAGKAADSTKTKEAYANTRSNSLPAKAADHHQAAGHKPVLQHERVHSFPTRAR